MKKDELLDIIYTYYPKGVTNEKLENYIKTSEYALRKQACEIARENNKSWLSLKKKLAVEVESLYGRYADYSVLGTTPSYYLRIYVDDWFNNFDVAEIAIVISVIAPVWTYFYENGNLDRIYSFDSNFIEGLNFIEFMNKIINEDFKGYEYLPKKYHQISVEDISSSHKQAPNLTIFDALFID